MYIKCKELITGNEVFVNEGNIVRIKVDPVTNKPVALLVTGEVVEVTKSYYLRVKSSCGSELLCEQSDRSFK